MKEYLRRNKGVYLNDFIVLPHVKLNCSISIYQKKEEEPPYP
jgi:hypothetical protein